MNTDDILDQIDHALADHTVGEDAMRWTPEPAPEPEAPVGWLTVDFIPHLFGPSGDPAGRVSWFVHYYSIGTDNAFRGRVPDV